MPTIDCPGGPVQGPIETAEDGALGLDPGASIRNAIRHAREEADDLVIEAIEDDYECASGCTLIMGACLIVGVPRQKGPPRRAWWTLWIAYWSVATVTATRSVECRKT